MFVQSKLAEGNINITLPIFRLDKQQRFPKLVHTTILHIHTIYTLPAVRKYSLHIEPWTYVEEIYSATESMAATNSNCKNSTNSKHGYNQCISQIQNLDNVTRYFRMPLRFPFYALYSQSSTGNRRIKIDSRSERLRTHSKMYFKGHPRIAARTLMVRGTSPYKYESW